MGIPQFFKYVRTKYPQVLQQVSLSDDNLGAGANIGCDELFLDFNCAVHKCARLVLDKLKAGITESPSTINSHTLNDLVISESIDYLLHLCRRIRPTELIYVAIDGVPPRSKMVQQRSRRYISQWTRSRLLPHSSSLASEPKGIDELWDSSCITPGTSFIRILAARLSTLSRVLKKEGIRAKYIVSSADEPDEGEQKIFKIMRHPNQKSKVRYVYGLDADLMLLGAVSPASGIKILRPMDGDETHQMYHLIDIKTFRDHVIHKRICSEEGPLASAREFVALMSLIGNDFIPGLSCLKISEGAIDFLLASYKNILTDFPAGITLPIQVSIEDNDKEIPALRLDAFAGLINEIAKDEDARLRTIDRVYYETCRSYALGRGMFSGRQSTEENEEREIERYPLQHPFPDVIKPGSPGWRPRYYRYLFSANDVRLVRNVCEAYLVGVSWSLAYHYQCPVNLSWHFRYAYAPTALDLANHLTVASIDEKKRTGQPNPTFPSSVPSTSMPPKKPSPGIGSMVFKRAEFDYYPDMQLLMVLPPESLRAQLSSPAMQKLPLSLEDGCSHFYPTNFNFLTYLKTFLSDCHPILPEIDETKLRTFLLKEQASEGVQESLDKKKLTKKDTDIVPTRAAPRKTSKNKI